MLFRASRSQELESLRCQPDGQEFLLNLPLEWSSPGPIMVAANWTEKLRESVIETRNHHRSRVKSRPLLL